MRHLLNNAFELSVKGIIFIHSEETGIGLIIAFQDPFPLEVIKGALEEAGLSSQYPAELLNVELPLRVGIKEFKEFEGIFGKLFHRHNLLYAICI